jgi:pimeloyl-ACP methyl ester carboxylesterase
MYLGVAFSGTGHLRTAAQEAAAIPQNFAAARVAERAAGTAAPPLLGDLPLVVLAPGAGPAEAGELVSASDEDRVAAVTDELQAELATLSSNGRYVRVAGSGHYIQIDRPEVVTDAIRSVVDAARAARERQEGWVGAGRC